MDPTTIPPTDIDQPISFKPYTEIPEGFKSKIHFQPVYVVEGDSNFYYGGEPHQQTILEDANNTFIKLGSGFEKSIKPVTSTISEQVQKVTSTFNKE